MLVRERIQKQVQHIEAQLPLLVDKPAPVVQNISTSPFITALGYNPHDLAQVDITIQDSLAYMYIRPSILIVTRCISQEPEILPEILEYMSKLPTVVDVIGITNGSHFQFYAPPSLPEPFWCCDLTQLFAADFAVLYFLCRESYDLRQLVKQTSESIRFRAKNVAVSTLYHYLQKQLEEPSEEFVTFMQSLPEIKEAEIPNAIFALALKDALHLLQQAGVDALPSASAANEFSVRFNAHDTALGYQASVRQLPTGFLVLAGSRLKENLSAKAIAHGRIQQYRDELLAKGVIGKNIDGLLVFLRNDFRRSSSTLCSIICGRSSTGKLTLVQLSTGRTLHEIEASEADRGE